jgi:hypothetical protein
MWLVCMKSSTNLLSVINQLEVASAQKVWLACPQILNLEVHFLSEASLECTQNCNFDENRRNFNASRQILKSVHITILDLEEFWTVLSKREC